MASGSAITVALLWAQTLYAAEVSCSDFAHLFTKTTRGVFAFGYLEGIQAALTKEITDVLVPVSHRDHPIWWVTPGGASSVEQFSESLLESCKTHPKGDVLAAVRRTALRKGGWPAFGMFIDRNTGKLASKPDSPNKNIMGEATVKCFSYKQMHENNRQALVTGYFTGTEVFRLVMAELTKTDDPFWMAWPLGTEPTAMRHTVDTICSSSKDEDSTLRDILWVKTIEMVVKKSK